MRLAIALLACVLPQCLALEWASFVVVEKTIFDTEALKNHLNVVHVVQGYCTYSTTSWENHMRGIKLDGTNIAMYKDQYCKGEPDIVIDALNTDSCITDPTYSSLCYRVTQSPRDDPVDSFTVASNCGGSGEQGSYASVLPCDRCSTVYSDSEYVRCGSGPTRKVETCTWFLVPDHQATYYYLRTMASCAMNDGEHEFVPLKNSNYWTVDDASSIYVGEYTGEEETNDEVSQGIHIAIPISVVLLIIVAAGVAFSSMRKGKSTTSKGPIETDTVMQTDNPYSDLVNVVPAGDDVLAMSVNDPVRAMSVNAPVSAMPVNDPVSAMPVRQRETTMPIDSAYSDVVNVVSVDDAVAVGHQHGIAVAEPVSSP